MTAETTTTPLTTDEARRLTERIRTRLVARIAADPAAVFPQIHRREPKLVGRHLYLMQAGSGPVKIGRANDVEARRRALQPGSAFPIRVLAVLPERGYLERELHHRFFWCRLEGEWFEPVESILAWFGVQR